MTILRQIFYVLLPSLIASLFSVISTSAADLTSLRVASSETHSTVMEAITEGDGSKLASVFASDGAVISPGGQVIEGRLTIRATATLLLTTMGTGKLSINRADLVLIDETGYETGQYSLRQPLDGGKYRTYSGRYTIVWKLEDKAWKIFRVIGLR